MNSWPIRSSNAHKKRCQRGKSKQAVQPSVCAATGENAFLSRITESMFAVSIQIKQQSTVLKKILSTIKPLHIVIKKKTDNSALVYEPHSTQVVFNN